MNKQEKIWEGEFCVEYTIENSDFNKNEMLFYDKHGITLEIVYQKIFGDLDRNYRILEVGCNVGHKLERLQMMGFKNLYGLDINAKAIETGEINHPDIHFIHGTLNDLNYYEKFDIVMTNYMLIHVSPEFISETLQSCYDFSARYLFHMEFDSPTEEKIKWSGKDDICWKRPMIGYYSGYRVEDIKQIKLPRVEDNSWDRAVLWAKY